MLVNAVTSIRLPPVIFTLWNKSRTRDRYLVVSSDPTWCSIRKFTGNQLRKCAYRVKKSDYRVSASHKTLPNLMILDAYSSDDEDPQPPDPPDIPDAIDISVPEHNLPDPRVSAPQSDEETELALSSQTDADNTQSRLLRPRRNIRKPARFDDFVMWTATCRYSTFVTVHMLKCCFDVVVIQLHHHFPKIV